MADNRMCKEKTKMCKIQLTWSDVHGTITILGQVVCIFWYIGGRTMRELDELKKNGYSLDDLEKLRMKLISEGADANETELKEIEELKNTLQSSASADPAEIQKKLSISQVAELVKELVGDRSIRKAAADSGVAASYISGILREKYLPSAEILRKLTTAEAKPQNGVRLEDLMKAAGYISSDPNEDSMMPDLTQKGTDEIVNRVMEKVRDNKAKSGVQKNGYDRISIFEEKDIARVTSMTAGILYKTLSEKGIMFSSVQNLDWREARKTDMAIHVPQKNILEWWFDFGFLRTMPVYRNGVSDEFHSKAHMIIRSRISNFFFLEPRADRKVSIVIDNKDVFGWAVLRYEGKLSYRGDLSLILIDIDSLSVAAEVYLAHYSDQDTSSEFYIV